MFKTELENSEGKKVRVEVQPHTAFKGLGYLRTFASDIVGVGKALDLGGDTGEVGLNFEKVANHLSSVLIRDDFSDLIKSFLEGTTVDNKWCGSDFDTIFQAEYGLLLDVLTYTIQVNYGNLAKKKGLFLTTIMGLIGKIPKRM